MPTGVYQRKQKEERFWEKVFVCPYGGCWEWIACRQQNGYGRLGQEYAHRLCYETMVGAIPKGLDVMHSCDNRGCVNPMHLSVGTRKDNMQDAARKGRVTTRKGEECHFSKLTKDSVIAIRADGRSISEIAEDYNICNYNVSQIKRKETWKHV